jgi:hypothetical protein
MNRGAVLRKAWWSMQRRRYTLIVATPISAVFLLVIWGLFEERLPCLEITGFSILFGSILFLPGLAFANISYFLGPLSEAYAPSQRDCLSSFDVRNGPYLLTLANFHSAKLKFNRCTFGTPTVRRQVRPKARL